MSEQYRVEERVPGNGDLVLAKNTLIGGVYVLHSMGKVLVPVEPPSQQPRSLEWARGYVASGGAVWVFDPVIKYSSSDTHMMHCLHNWHPWGDRAWLRALPDGTRVRGPHTASVYVKMGNGLRHEHNPHDLRPILFDEINSIGWDLVREPVMDAVASATECDSDDMLANRIDTLGRQIEQHDAMIFDLAVRLARLERCAE